MTIKSLKQYLELASRYLYQKEEYKKKTEQMMDKGITQERIHTIQSFGFRMVLRRIELKEMGRKLSFARALNKLTLYEK